MTRLRRRTLLTLFFVAVFGYAVVAAWDMPIQARLFPLSIGLLGLALLLLQLVRELRPAAAAREEGSAADIDFTAEEDSAEGRAKTRELFGWIFGFVFALWLIGFLIAIPLMILLFLLRHRESALVTATLPLSVGLATWGLFDRLLNLPLPRGELFQWLGWQ